MIVTKQNVQFEVSLENGALVARVIPMVPDNNPLTHLDGNAKGPFTQDALEVMSNMLALAAEAIAARDWMVYRYYTTEALMRGMGVDGAEPDRLFAAPGHSLQAALEWVVKNEGAKGSDLCEVACGTHVLIDGRYTYKFMETDPGQ